MIWFTVVTKSEFIKWYSTFVLLKVRYKTKHRIRLEENSEWIERDLKVAGCVLFQVSTLHWVQQENIIAINS